MTAEPKCRVALCPCVPDESGLCAIHRRVGPYRTPQGILRRRVKVTEVEPVSILDVAEGVEPKKEAR